MPARSDPLFPVAQRLILSLYDGGVLSPAVLERVIASIGDKGWDTEPDALSSDGRSVRAVVVSVMMPGNALENVEKDFDAVIMHIVGATGRTAAPAQRAARRAASRSSKASPSAIEETGADQTELIEQLAGRQSTSRKRTKSARVESKQKPVSTFNPLFNAAIPKK